MPSNRKSRDDFVLTIDSDDDAGTFPGLEEEDESEQEQSEAEPEPNSASRSSKKRKRQLEATITANGTKAKKKRKQASSEDEDEEGDEPEGWADRKRAVDSALNPDFEFQLEQDAGVVEDFDGWEDPATQSSIKKGVDMDVLIARRQAKTTAGPAPDPELSSDEDEELPEAENDVEESDDEVFEQEEDSADEIGFGMGVPLGEGNSSGDEEVVSEGDESESDVADDMDLDHDERQANNSDGGDSEDDAGEVARQKEFFAPEEPAPNAMGGKEVSFQSMKLSRPILRGLTSVGFQQATPIQAKTIPMALLGKDVVGGAVTGSGKTAAFMIPILERLLYRDKKTPTSRVAVLMPTRELAVQCFNVATKLASFTDITFCQLVGGFSLREQESILKKRPDVIIATPGRFIDHMRNSASFTIDTLEILVLDEADRMLEDGFADELNEILTTIPKSRQTMLFSATMTNSVDKLIRVGLNRPVRIMVDAKKQTVGTLTQEFVRLRQGREDKRLATLLHLCSTIFTERCIVFFRQKKDAHRIRVLFGLCGFKVAELHGSMSQEQRITSVEAFRAGRVTHLLATDVASRGLDIKGVESVVNYEAPQSHEIYLHRVGRTARAGRTGKACTLAADPDRKVVRAAVKMGKSQGAKIVSRVIEPKLVDEWATKIESLEEDVKDLLKEEKEERQLQSVEMQVKKGENMIAHEKEIMSRPKRDWFQSEKEKLAAKKAGLEELNGFPRAKKGKVKLSNKDKKKLDATKDRKETRMWKKGKTERGKSGAPKKPIKGKTKSKR